MLLTVMLGVRFYKTMKNAPGRHQMEPIDSVCVCVCACVRACVCALAQVCFDPVWVLCFVMSYVLQLRETAHQKVNYYYW